MNHQAWEVSKHVEPSLRRIAEIAASFGIRGGWGNSWKAVELSWQISVRERYDFGMICMTSFNHSVLKLW